MKVILIFSLIFSHFYQVFCANFLFLNGVASPSHHIWNRALMEGVAANKNHNLTIVSVDIDKKTLPNMHYIYLDGVYESMWSGEDSLDIFQMAQEKPYETTASYYDFGRINCEGILKSKGLDVILNYPDDFKFDAVVFDFTCGPCLLPLLHKFKYPPLISVSPFNNPPFTEDLVGGHKYPAYVPFFALTYGTNMNFLQRLFNTALFKWDSFYRHYIFLPNMEKMVRKRYGFKDMPSLGELEKKTVLMLINNHASIDFPEPMVPNVIPVGGLQIVDPKPLTDELKSFIESGKKGTVLMSLGTNMRSDILPKEIQINILTTFRELPQYNFLWKFESDELPIEKPDNVKISKFLPQTSILAQPHLKAFITHSGLLSYQESLWYGKPMIGIPIFCDQHRNLERSINFGTAEKILFQTLTVEEFKEKILRVLEDPKYTKNTQRISRQFRDQPEKPLKRAVWWIEYILRNPKPDHLKSPTLELGNFVSNSFDILASGLVVTISVLIFSIQLFCCRKKFRKTEKEKKDK